MKGSDKVRQGGIHWPVRSRDDGRSAPLHLLAPRPTATSNLVARVRAESGIVDAVKISSSCLRSHTASAGLHSTLKLGLPSPHQLAYAVVRSSSSRGHTPIETAKGVTNPNGSSVGFAQWQIVHEWAISAAPESPTTTAPEYESGPERRLRWGHGYGGCWRSRPLQQAEIRRCGARPGISHKTLYPSFPALVAVHPPARRVLCCAKVLTYEAIRDAVQCSQLYLLHSNGTAYKQSDLSISTFGVHLPLELILLIPRYVLPTVLR